MLISVVISVLNKEQFPVSTLESLAVQTGQYELIVVMAADSPGTGLSPLADKAQVIAALGSSRAVQYNAGAAAASGQVLLFLESETRLPADALMAIERNFQLLPQTAGGNFHLEFEPGSLFAKFLNRILKWWRYRGSYGTHTAIFVRTDVFEALHGFQADIKFADYEFARRMEQYGPTLFLHEAVIASKPNFNTALSWSIAPIFVNRKA